jgi:hypothetical protein
LAKATEQEEDSKKKVIALDKEIERVREQKVHCFDTAEIDQLHCFFFDLGGHVAIIFSSNIMI